MRWESVSFLNRGVWGDWAGAVIDCSDFHTKRVEFRATFQGKIGLVGVLVRRSFFFAFACFSGGFDPRSARAGAVETYFSIFEPALKKVCFVQNFGSISRISGFQIRQKAG